MTLPLTNDISFLNLATEFGQATTNIDLNSYTPGGTVNPVNNQLNSSPVNLNSFHGVTKGLWFRSSPGGNNGFQGCGAIAYGPSNTLHIVSYGTNSSGSSTVVISLLNAVTGAETWTRQIVPPLGYYNTLNSVAVDASNNTFVIIDCASTVDGTLLKYDSSGSVSWQTRISQTNRFTPCAVACDSAGNAYVGGTSVNQVSGYGYDMILLKFNSSGTNQWGVRYGYNSPFGSEYIRSISFDSSDNVYCCGNTYSPTDSQYYATAMKFNSSGTLQWQRQYGPLAGGGTQFYCGATFPSSGNFYVTGYYDTGSANGRSAVLVKYNSSGTVQWQRKLTGGSSMIAFTVSVDASENVYIGGQVYGPDPTAFLAKYNSSGTLQWQYYYDQTGTTESINALVAASDGYLYVGGQFGTSSQGFVQRTSQTPYFPYGGLYTSTLYVQPSSYTSSDPGFAEAAGSVPSQTNTQTYGSGSQSSSSITLSGSVNGSAY